MNILGVGVIGSLWASKYVSVLVSSHFQGLYKACSLSIVLCTKHYFNFLLFLSLLLLRNVDPSRCVPNCFLFVVRLSQLYVVSIFKLLHHFVYMVSEHEVWEESSATDLVFWHKSINRFPKRKEQEPVGYQMGRTTMVMTRWNKCQPKVRGESNKKMNWRQPAQESKMIRTSRIMKMPTEQEGNQKQRWSGSTNGSGSAERGEKKVNEDLRSREVDQTSRGARAKRQAGKTSRGKQPAKHIEEPQVELEGECREATST